jgi:uncharacterized protein (UPF0276 family)
MISGVVQAPLSNIQDAGLGLRACHYSYILEHLPQVPWFEVLTENYMVTGGMVLERLEQIRAYYPIVFHGVGMSLGSTDPLSDPYLSHLKQLIDRFKPAYISDHLCWTSFNQQYSHELLPLPFTKEAVVHVAERIKKVQEILGQRMLIENVSSYLTYKASTMPEWEFINEVAEQADCYILLDINNIYVSSYNHKFSAEEYLCCINESRVKQYHLAGYTDNGTHLIDTHGAKVSSAVWKLYEKALKKIGDVPTCIEWDNDIPEFSVLLSEAGMINNYRKKFMR